MSEPIEQPIVIEPITSSADGRRNSYVLGCGPLGQSMNYAACLWRQSVLSDPTIKTPADWAVCGQAAKSGQCAAIQMREQELLAGKSIYFRAREAVKQAADAARKWFMPSLEKTGGIKKGESTVTGGKKGSGKSMLDAIGDAGSLSDAITVAASEAPAVKPAPVVMPTAQAGESPLQMARRLAQAKAANGN